MNQFSKCDTFTKLFLSKANLNGVILKSLHGVAPYASWRGECNCFEEFLLLYYTINSDSLSTEMNDLINMSV